MSAALIDNTLYDAFGQRQVATIYTATNQYKVILEVAPQFRNDPNALSKIYVSAPTGAQVPLSAFAHFTNRRCSRCRSTTRASSRRSRCRSTWRPGKSLGQAVDAIKALADAD